MKKYKHYIALLDRCYLYSDPVGLTDSMLELRPDAMVLNLHDKKYPYTGNQRLEAGFREQLHAMLNLCDAAGVDSYLGCANLSKFDNGFPGGIPTVYDDELYTAGEPCGYELQAGQRVFHVIDLPAGSRAWRLPLEVYDGKVTCYWFRTMDGTGSAAAKYPNLTSGDHTLHLHSLEAQQWTLMVVAQERSKFTVYALQERQNPGELDGDVSPYLYRGPLGRSSWLQCRSPEFARMSSIFFENTKRMRAIKAEFGVHTSFKSGMGMFDEFEGVGWTEEFMRTYKSAGQAVMRAVAYTVQQADSIFGAPPLFFGDRLGHERTVFNRTNNPRGGGMSTTIDNLPAMLHGIPVMWYEGDNPERIFADLEGVARKGLPYLIGHQVGEISTESVLRTFDLCAQRDVPLPMGSFWFGWNRDLLTAEYVGGEMAKMPGEV